MNIRLALAAGFLLGTGTPVWAQVAGDPGTQSGKPRDPRDPRDPIDTNEMVPQGLESAGPGQTQTPAVEETLVPSPATAGSENAPDALGTDGSNQPMFQRDVVPQSTDPERRAPEQRAPAPRESERIKPGAAVPPKSEGQSGQQPTGQQPAGRQEDQVTPDVVPDRRFETFDSDTQGTPEMAPMPQRDSSGGGTRGLPPGGYGIGPVQ